MATRVNKKLVAVLVVSLVILAVGVTMLAVMVRLRGPERYKAMGDAAKAEGNWRSAAELYERAVGKERNNLEYINLWMDALEHSIPLDETEAKANYGWISNLLRTRTDIQSANAEFHIAWLEHLYDMRAFADLSEQSQRMCELVPVSDPLYYVGQRYHGLAGSVLLLNGNYNDADRLQIRTELLTALEHDPKDSKAAESLLSCYFYEMNNLTDLGQIDKAHELQQQAEQFVNKFVNSNPDDALAHLIYSRLNRVLSALQAESHTADPALVLPHLEAAEQLCLNSDVPWDVALATAREIVNMDNSRGLERAINIIKTTMEHDPECPTLWYALANYQRQIRDYTAAYQTLEMIVDHENLPTSNRSVLLFSIRINAIAEQFDMKVAEYSEIDSADKDAKQAGMDAILDRYNAFMKLTSDNDPRLLYMDGQLALLQHQPQKAVTKFEKYLELTGSTDLRALMLSVQCLNDIGQTGAAYSRLQEIVSATQGNYIPALKLMINIDMDRGRYAEAESNIQKILATTPSDEWSVTMLDRINSIKGVDDAGKLDPVTKAITDARREIDDTGNTDAGITILETAYTQHPDDLRLLLQLTLLENFRGNQTQALAYIDKGLAINPNHQRFLLMKAEINQEDIRPVINKIVDADTQLDKVNKLLKKVEWYTKYGYNSDAEDLFNQAAAIDPDHPEIVEGQFTRLLTKARDAESQGDNTAVQISLKQAETLAARASELNLDQAEGLTYSGRLQLARGNYSAAITAFSQATNIKAWDSTVWRYLAIAYRDSGKYNDALTAFSQSLSKKDDDINTLLEYVQLQVIVSDFEGALKNIRRARELAPGDPKITQRYLTLEGLYGNRTEVIKTRTKTLASEPDNLTNAITLAELLTLSNQSNKDTQDIDRAGEILKSLSPDEPIDRLRVADALAQWYRHNDKIDEGNQLDKGKNCYLEFINTEPPAEVMIRAYIALAGYLFAAGREAEGVSALQAGQHYQDPVHCEADRALGAHYVTIGDNEQALEYYQAALDADPQAKELSLQVIDLLLSLSSRSAAANNDTTGSEANDYVNQALVRLIAHTAKFGTGVETSLLGAAISGAKGNIEEAAGRFDDTAKQYPDEWRVYRQRARFNLSQYIATGDSSLIKKIYSDVQRACELNTTDISSLLVRASLAQNMRNPQTGKPAPDNDDLISVYQQILQLQPRNSTIRRELVNLYASRNNYNAAITLANEAISLDETNPVWHGIVGQMRRSKGDRLNEYVTYFEHAFELDPSANRLITWVEAIITAKPAISFTADQKQNWLDNNLQKADAILAEHQDLVTDNILLLILQGRVTGSLNKTEQSEESFRNAYQLIVGVDRWVDRYNLKRLWHGNLNQVVMPVNLMTKIGVILNPKNLGILDNILIAQSLCDAAGDDLSDENNQKLWSAGMDLLKTAKSSLSSDSIINQLETNEHMTYVTLCGHYFGSNYFKIDNWEEAVNVWKWVLEVMPEDIECNNNIAFTLADKLKRAEEALEYAKRAYGVVPDNAVILDTYGYVLYLNNQLTESEQILRQSLQIQPLATTRYHLGLLLYKQGKTIDAQQELQMALELATASGNTQQSALINSLLTQISEGN